MPVDLQNQQLLTSWTNFMNNWMRVCRRLVCIEICMRMTEPISSVIALQLHSTLIIIRARTAGARTASTLSKNSKPVSFSQIYSKRTSLHLKLHRVAATTKNLKKWLKNAKPKSKKCFIGSTAQSSVASSTVDSAKEKFELIIRNF